MTIDRSTCTAARHGDENAYSHGCSCRDACDAARIYRRKLAAGIRRRIPSAGTARRIQAMCVDGHSMADLGAELLISGKAVRNILYRDQVLSSTAWLVHALAAKKRDTPGGSPLIQRRAHEALWLPWEAWDYAAIDDPAPVTVQEALVGWLDNTPDPSGVHGPLAHLLARLDQLLPFARGAMTRRAHALYAAGSLSPLVWEGDRVYYRDRDRLRRLPTCGFRPDRWRAA